MECTHIEKIMGLIEAGRERVKWREHREEDAHNR